MEDCKHRWVSTSCQGGEPVFKMNRQMSHVPHAHVICELCNDRTWMSKEAWNAWSKNAGHGTISRMDLKPGSNAEIRGGEAVPLD